MVLFAWLIFMPCFLTFIVGIAACAYKHKDGEKLSKADVDTLVILYVVVFIMASIIWG